MDFIYSSGGREKYFKASKVRDCVTRAIANATGIDYLEIYNGLNEEAKKERTSRRKRGRQSNARNGVFTATAKRYIERTLGWVWKPCMTIGGGCQVHVKEGELPSTGTYILNLSKHFSCWKDNKLYDTYDCSRHGTRCVYGYWVAPKQEELKAKKEQELELARVKEMEQQAINETKAKIETIKKKYEPSIKKLEKKIKDLKHQLVLETNRMNKEIKKVKEIDGNNFVNQLLDNEDKKHKRFTL